jgi:DNA-binding CsgD family transcriptional regulator
MDGAGLEAAAAAAIAHTRLEGTAGGLSLVMDELAYGVLLASAKGQLLHANQTARHELARRKVLSVHDGQLHASDAAQARVLLQALAKAEGGRRSLIALRAGATRLNVAIVPLRPERPQDPGAVALILSRASVCDAVMLCFFARTHGLTPAEEQVLGILCQGFSAPDIAGQLHVAVSTVRSHVRSLCAKTQCNGVRALVGMVAVLPPIGAAHIQDPLH